MSSYSKKKKLPKSVKELSPEQLLEILKKKKECNAIALRIVETLSEQLVDKEWMLQNLFYINQDHYSDAVTERSINTYCGYPLCVTNLANVPKQQYKIDLRSKTVFDITERKKYCSSKCFRASEYIKGQLLTSPLWFRENEVCPKFQLINLAPSPKSPTVNLININIKSGDHKKSEITTQESNSSQHKQYEIHSIRDGCVTASGSSENVIVSDDGSGSKDDRLNKFDDRDEIDEDKEEMSSNCDRGENFCLENITIKKEENTENDIINNDDVKGTESLIEKIESTKSGTNMQIEDKNETRQIETPIEISCPPKVENPVLGPVEAVEKTLAEWFTINTFVYLLGEEKLKSEFEDYHEVIESLRKNETKPKKFDEITKIFEILNLDGVDERETELKPLPDYSELQNATRDLTIKVNAFYTGQLETTAPGPVTSETPQESSMLAMPLVDSHAQNALRRRLVIDRLNRVVGDMCITLGLPDVITTSEIREVVQTFSLSATNVMFRPREVFLMAVVIIKLISLKDVALSKELIKTDAKKRMTLLLMSYNLGADYLDNLMEWITDKDRLLRWFSS